MAGTVAIPPFLTACCLLAPLSQLVDTDGKVGYVREHPGDASPVLVLPPAPTQAPAAANGVVHALDERHFPPEPPPAAQEEIDVSSSQAPYHQMPS